MDTLVEEDALVVLDIDLDDRPTCDSPVHDTPEVATHRISANCGCSFLLCTPCAEEAVRVKRTWNGEKAICGYCGKIILIPRIVIEPLPT